MIDKPNREEYKENVIGIAKLGIIKVIGQLLFQFFCILVLKVLSKKD